jgi:FAD/FMN-containing dehydrogenase
LAITAIWKNWGETQTAMPVSIERPATIIDAIMVLQRARKRGLKVRCFGGGHSWSPLFPTNGVLLSMECFKKIQLLEDGVRVSVETGVTVDELSAFFRANNVALPSNAGFGVGEASYVGLVSTGCHGSGIEMLSVSDYAVGFTVLTSTGEVRQFDGTAETGGENMLNAVRISLGMFGVILRVTFQVVSAYNVKVEEYKQEIDEALQCPNEMVTDNDYAELSWMPFNEQAWLQRANKTNLPSDRVGVNPPKSAFRLNIEQAASKEALNKRPILFVVASK